MSICPKNKSSKARRDKRRANWKMSAPNLVKCSKCGELMMPHRVCKDLWLLQQKRNHCNGLICRQVKELSIMLDSFLYNMMLGSKAPTMMPADCSVLCTPTILPIIRISWD